MFGLCFRFGSAVPLYQLFGVLPALAVHGFQALLVFGQGGHALGAVGRNDAPCARLLHSQGAAYLFVVAPGPQGKAHTMMPNLIRSALQPVFSTTA